MNDFAPNPRLERMLDEARREEEERQRRSRNKTKARDHWATNFQWVRYIVYIWAARMSFLLIGGMVPTMSGLFGLFSGGTKEASYSPLQTFVWINLLKEDFSLFSQVSTARSQPSLVHNVPVISEDSTLALLEVLGRSTESIPLKLSRNTEFSYFDQSRLWSSLLQDMKSYEVVSHRDLHLYMECLTPLLAAMTSSNDQKQTCSVERRVTHPMNVYVAFAEMSKWMENFAPSLSLLSESSGFGGLPTQSNLWLSTANVTAQFHYDISDNFLLQLVGTKTVIIVSPEALSVLRPYPSLHPLWRQSSADAATLATILPHASTVDSPSKTGNELWHQVNNVWKGSSSSSGSGNPASDSGNRLLYNSTFTVWETTLTPGTMLYLPAGFFHRVTTESEVSLSVNTWFPSAFAELYGRLQRLDLPFDKSDSLSKKVSSYFVVMMNLCQLWEVDNRDCLWEEMDRRFEAVSYQFSASGMLEAQQEECDRASQLTFCSQKTFQLAEFTIRNTRYANEIALLSAKSRLPRALQVLSVLEYLEEVLVVIFQQEAQLRTDGERPDAGSVSLLPCTVQAVLSQCQRAQYVSKF